MSWPLGLRPSRTRPSCIHLQSRIQRSIRSSRRVVTCLAVLCLAASVADGRDLLAKLSDGSSVELPPLDPSVPSPADFLGYELGERFTHHEQIVRYLDHLAANSDRVKVWKYGETYEGRPLELVAITSPTNLARLEQVQTDLGRLARADQLGESELRNLLAETPVAVWLAYGVHGNESSSAEAAMAAAYVFAACQGEWSERLERGLILIDPLSNPDGRERYVHFYETQRGRTPDPLPTSAEHFENWPGGRQNHYLVDLNRDWAWQSQRETRDRIAAYRAWEPQVYVDFHEMSPQSTYFFPPAAEPIHPYISPKAVYWLETFGRANASAFDARGWVYYVGENFDLFYPGYGDSYPSLRGAIGMTYEMAGGGRAGQAYERRDGSVLALPDRVARHLTTSLSTARTAIDRKADLLADFAAFRRKSATAEVKTYLWAADQQESQAAAELLARHGVVVERLASDQTLRVRPHAGGASVSRAFAAGTFAVTTNQPLSPLIRALMDLDATLSQSFLEEQRRRIEQNRNSEFYDITAWSLPLAFNLETWVAGTTPTTRENDDSVSGGVEGAGELGYLLRPQGLKGYRLVSELQSEDVLFRVTLGDFTLDQKQYPAGTVFLPRRGNPDDLETRLMERAQALGLRVERTDSGYADAGSSLGSNNVVSVRPPTIGLLSGDGVSPTSFGFLWHLLDQQVRAKHHRLPVGSFNRLDLSEFDVLILPSGRYTSELGESGATKLAAWVKSGGVLVSVGRASSWLRQNKISSLKAWQPPKANGKDNEVVELTPSNRELYTPGAVLRTDLQRPHALTAGVDGSPAALFSGRTILLPTGNPRRDVVVAADKNPVLAGFAWPEAEERLANSLLVGLEPLGRGAVVVFSQDPAFRLFWRATAPVFLNTVLYGPSLAEAGHLH